ncbi:MAG: orotate phosphoribosyltransferase [Bacteroidales bacterium]|nr:orotate phosphoribosyltransferase [Bacteroidales bacterium]
MENTSVKIAEYLLQIKAIKLQPSNPFTWASGWKSPIYCDNRKTLSYPEIRSYISSSFARLISEKYKDADLIAGVATGAIAHGVLTAEKLRLPFVYVRSGAKDHGLGNQIEGYFEAGQRAVVVEDLISTGNSSLSAVKALRDAGCEVLGMTAIFTYEFKKAADSFAEEKCILDTLSNYTTLIDTALKTGYITQADMETLKEWRMNPSEWGKDK